MELNLMQVAAAVLNFLVLLFLLKKFLYKPVFNMLDAREAEIAGNLDAAAQANNDAQAMKEQYENEMRAAQTRVQEIIQDATKVGEDTRAEIVSKAKEEATMATERAKAEISREKDQALRELRNEVADLAIDVAEKVVGRTVNVADHQHMVEEFIKEVGDAK